MQGDIFELNQLTTSKVSNNHPDDSLVQPQPLSQSDVAIYNEDDLSHLLYVDHQQHHHHHHGYVKPLLQPIGQQTQPEVLPWSDYDSASDFWSDVDSAPATPLSPISEADAPSLDAYRQKGRRNALSVALEDGFEFPVFLGRQAEEWPSTLPREMRSPSITADACHPTTLPISTPMQGPKFEVLASQHINITSGPLMSWWPMPLEYAKDDWASEKAEWSQQAGDQACVQEPTDESTNISQNVGHYDVKPVDNIEGPLMMTWWPLPTEIMEHEWNERSYE
ncbi:hypothetical protein F5Y16DRAFT_68843 [Xylariaceae sp. FL0255]|nr:hypothetical protein F5Y16DRAFT_68843 [Xylariaceae sp. FL0255]